MLKIGALESLDADLRKDYEIVKSRVLSNLALVHLKDAEEFKDKDLIDKNLKKVLEFCDQDLEISSNNVKVYYRRGKAYYLKGDYEAAKKDISKALEKEPKNRECLLLLKDIEVHLKHEETQEKHIFRKVFQEENWENQAKEDEKWLSKLQTTGINLSGVDAVNLLLN